MNAAAEYSKRGGHMSHPVAPVGPVVKCPKCGCVIPLHPRGAPSHPMPPRRPMPGPPAGPPMGAPMPRPPMG